ncbi:MAG: lysozyme inhibitor LprI family protein [Chromatiales bacterium]|nr:lysozyme inhibitor LprI family protein [Chromatiales bacterium]
MGMQASASSSAAGISCAKAATKIESMICSSSTLRELDLELVKRYKEFQLRLPKEKRSTSTVMQRLWLKSRDRYCSGSLKKAGEVGDRFRYLPKYYASVLSGSMLNTHPSADMEKCLEDYYRDAIGGFKKGAQKSYLFLEQKKTSYSVDIGDVDKITLSRQPPEKGWGGHKMKAEGEAYAVYLYNNGKKTLLSEIGIFDSTDSMYPGAHEESMVNFIEIFLPESGNPVFSVVTSTIYEADRSCIDEEVSRTFFFVSDPLKRVHVSQVSNTHSCGGNNYYQASKQAGRWQSSGDSINFLRIENHSDMFYRVFSTATVFAVHSTGETTTRELNDSELQTLYGAKFPDVYRGLMEYYRENSAWLTDGYGNEECKPIVVALRNYYQIKESLDHATVGHIRVFYNNLDSYSEYDELVTRLYPLVKPLLEARELMRQSGKDPVNPGEMEIYSFREAFHEKTGYPKMDGCLAQTSSISSEMTLELWLYSFWLRRVDDGTDELTEKTLRSVMKYKENN